MRKSSVEKKIVKKIFAAPWHLKIAKLIQYKFHLQHHPGSCPLHVSFYQKNLPDKTYKYQKSGRGKINR